MCRSGWSSGNGGDNDRGGSDEILVRFQTQSEAIVSSQTNIVDAVPPTPRDMSSLPSRDSESVVGRLEECHDAKEVAQGRVR